MPDHHKALADPRPAASPHEARRAYEAFMASYAPELPALWDALPARMQRAWGAVVDTVRRHDQGQGAWSLTHDHQRAVSGQRLQTLGQPTRTDDAQA